MVNRRRLILKRLLCVVVPAFNEEKTLAASLMRLRKQVSPIHIYVISDGSSDATAELARRYVPNVLNETINRGKAQALKHLIDHYSLTSLYDHILFTDADSSLEPGFMAQILSHRNEKPACVVGRVKSTKKGLISAYRTYEYGLSHLVYKRAQSAMQAVVVAPGCASLYRSSIIDRLDFINRTITEDIDLTLQVHIKQLGRVIYAPRAAVITQDPLTFKDYWKQTTRWYTGFWQNYFLHRVYSKANRLNAEISLLLFDMVGWVAVISMLFFYPQLIWRLIELTYAALLMMAIVVILIERKGWAIKYTPLFALFPWLNTASYVYSLYRAVIVDRQTISWDKVDRY